MVKLCIHLDDGCFYLNISAISKIEIDGNLVILSFKSGFNRVVIKNGVIQLEDCFLTQTISHLLKNGYFDYGLQKKNVKKEKSKSLSQACRNKET